MEAMSLSLSAVVASAMMTKTLSAVLASISKLAAPHSVAHLLLLPFGSSWLLPLLVLPPIALRSRILGLEILASPLRSKHGLAESESQPTLGKTHQRLCPETVKLAEG